MAGQTMEISNKTKVLEFVSEVVKNMPSDWVRLTTHRLDIYNEALAKVEFLSQLESLFANEETSTDALAKLPTAYDYIRLGHPLSSVLEWAMAQLSGLKHEAVISFSSRTIPIMAILRKNLLTNKNSRIVYTNELPASFNATLLNTVYGYQFEIQKVDSIDNIEPFEGSTIFIAEQAKVEIIKPSSNIDFYVAEYPNLGSMLFVNNSKNEDYISEIQHVRRRETIAMTPANCVIALQKLLNQPTTSIEDSKSANKAKVLQSIKEITGSQSKAVVGSSGLSIQYAIVMGLIDHAVENHPGKAIKIIVPPNCYGGTNDQARRVAACLDSVEVLDMPVDGNNNMVQSIDKVLSACAQEDAVPYIIAEIPTNPRVEVPDLEQLKEVLSRPRTTSAGNTAIDPVFILDQTFCPNVSFLRNEDILSPIRTISYVSGSKFPSGGKCTAGYCVANEKAAYLMDKIELNLNACDNEATALQYEYLAEQMPSMIQRIADAYKNTREFVNFIKEHLPTAKINFVSEELAAHGFTPSVFSLDLPTKGNTDEEREMYKRELNNTLINMMINEIPQESKYCVSYGQLKGCYWTIPATSTQGTTKEGDKDYIARVALSANMNLEKHKDVFLKFVEQL